MSKFYYDFHLHSCLSPCGDDDMTPANLVRMAALNGLDIIALTDHNCTRNTPAAVEVGRRAGITVIPGMELETSEEVHVVMLFPTVEAALACGEEVGKRRFHIKNRVEVYGRQTVMDADDKIIGEEDDLLVVATDVGVYEAGRLADRYGGIAYPAHADKPSNGIIQILGALDPAMGFAAAEASPHADDAFRARLIRDGYRVMYGSDAHYLEDIGEPGVQNVLELDEPTAQAVIRKIKGQ